MLLSVVIICRNQQWNIARLIESVLDEQTQGKIQEIVLVDSASTDRTIEIASRYPITILRLRPNQRLTAAAGRYVGYQRTTGDFVLFLDGDMELNKGWLDQALAIFREQPHVALVTGQVIDLPKTADKVEKPPIQHPVGTATEIAYSGGAGMYRRAMLETVGSFNPYIYSDEEPDVCIRLRHKGYRLIKLSYPIAYHYTETKGTFTTLIGRWKRNLYLGTGQNMRYHLGTEMFIPYIKERGYGCLPIVGLIVGLSAFLWSCKSGQRLWFRLWSLLVGGYIMKDIVQKREIYRTAASLLERIFIIDGTIRGFLIPAPHPAKYHGLVDEIQTAPNQLPTQPQHTNCFSENMLLQAALKLHHHILTKHWQGQAIIGPDPGVRYNYRIGRFIKSYLSSFPWNDNYYYLQAQSYWILDNWKLFATRGEPIYRDIAQHCSKYVLAQQRDDGAWDYPKNAWRGRIATVEGAWASIGLIESYRQTRDPAYLDGVLRWHRYMNDVVKYRRNGEELAINYFANLGTARVVNNSTTVLRLLAEIVDITGDTHYLEPGPGLITFIRHTQLETGELPYSAGGTQEDEPRVHFQCYQYNAYECLSLIRYYELTQDPTMLPIIQKLLTFLRTGVGPDGHAYYACHNRSHVVTYHAAALAGSFIKAHQIGIEGYEEVAKHMYAYVLGLQRPDGGFIHSQRDYYILSDRRSYPRYLSMLLYHLLQGEIQPT